MNKPQKLSEYYRPPFLELEKSCEQYIDSLDSDDYNEDRAEGYVHDIFEKAIEAFYGEDIWEYINKDRE